MSRESNHSLPYDTIVAVATPIGVGAIGIVRLSGPCAVQIASSSVALSSGKLLAEARPHTATRAQVCDPNTRGVLDEVVVLVMAAPRSYTGDDVVEISCHGNPALLLEVLRILIDGGARLAAPGEFTRRAYLNGRIDLLQAEAVALLIEARTTRAMRLAVRQMEGSLSSRIRAWREGVLDVVAGLEVALDFPDDEVGLAVPEAVVRIQAISADLRKLLEEVERGRVAHYGLKVMIAGAQNVGKSSLLNALLGRSRAIVSSEAGTTRDLIDGTIVVEGIPVQLVDGAGFGPARGAADREGMRQTRAAIEASDLVMVVLDRSRPVSTADQEVLAITEGRNRLILANKIDLESAWSSVEADCACSAASGSGISEVLARLTAWVRMRIGHEGSEDDVVTSLRAMGRMGRAQTLLEGAVGTLERTGAPLEVALVDVKEAMGCLEEAVGIDAGDAILDRIFATFCVGK